MKPRLLLLAIGTFFFAALGLHAQFTWTGAGGDENFTTAANWLGGVAPTGSPTDDVIFGNSSSNFPLFPGSFSLRNVTYSASSSYYFLNSNSGGTLTLTGNVNSTAGSSAFLVFSSAVSLAAGTHTIDTQGGDIYFFYNTLSGSGNIVKTGATALVVVSSADYSNVGYTGNVDLQAGLITVAGDGALGTGGTVTMDGGTLQVADYDTDHLVTLTNNLLFSSTVNFSGAFQSPSLLTITGTATALGGVGNVALNVDSNTQVNILGNVGETSAGTMFTMSGGGTVIFGGVSSYTGGTVVMDPNSVLIFGSTAPTVGSLQSTSGGYIGSEVTTNLQTGFLDHFDKPNTDGIVGFDSPVISSPQTFSGPIDLTGFNPSAQLGTATSAILTGTITPQGSDYLFGGRGILTVNSNLADVSGPADVQVYGGLQLYLGGNNTYTGYTEAVAGAIIFSGPNSLPAGADIYADAQGYIGQTESSGLSAATYLSHFYTPDTFGVVGFDADNPVAGRIVSEDIDFSAFDQGAFLGTSTNVTFTGVITPYSETYRFTGFRNGQLTVASILIDDIVGPTPRNVIIGLDPEVIVNNTAPGVTYSPSVTLTGDNSYTGGTLLQSGQLIIGQSNGVVGTDATTALGGPLGGELTIGSFGSVPTGLSVTTAGIIIPNAIDFGSNDGFTLGGANDFTLSGNLKGCNSSGFVDKIGDDTVTLSGDNSNLDLGFQVLRGQLIFATDTAAGTETLYLRNNDVSGGIVEFTSGAPAMGSLQGESSTSVILNTAGNLTINQTTDDSYDGTISGTGGIIKSGGASLTLSNSNTYGGSTTITGGTLVAANNNALSTGSVIIDGGALSVGGGITISNPITFGGSGGTLRGNGTFSSPITIGANVVLAPGNSPGQLNFTGGLTWDQSGTYNIQVQSATGASGSGYDSINVTGGLNFTATLGNPFTFNLLSLDGSGSPGDVTDFNSTMSYAWLIAHPDSLSGFDPANISIVTTGFTNSLGSGFFYVNTVGNDIYLNFSPVPEPSTYALLASGVALLALGYRRNRGHVRRNS